ncbi:glycosyltransferase [Vibrio cholerae]|nr:glycosyltransferase [Vibrio cholerae]EJL6597386.1 glycosyltransferase [Vibrio cholerae]
MKLISIITATYNSVETIEASINSVLKQKTDLVEYIVIDGGSTDGTLAILGKYSDEIDVILSEPDGGIYDALNKGVRLASGSHVLVIGSDDELLNISAVTEYLSLNSNAGALVFDVESYDPNTGLVSIYKCRLPDVNNVEKDFYSFPLHHQGFICKNYKGLRFSLDLGLHADLKCMIDNLVMFNGVKVDSVLARYRTGGASDYVSIRNLISFYRVARALNISHSKAVMYNPFGFLRLCLKSFMPRWGTILYRFLKSNVLSRVS